MSILEDELGDIIAKARIGQGCSKEQIALKTGIPERDIERIETYELRPDRQSVERLAEALALDPEKLVRIAEDGWAPPAVELPADGPIIESLAVPYGNYAENCNILACRETGAAAVVDPGGAVEAIMQRLQELEARLETVLITHAHADHVGGLRRLVRDDAAVRIANHQLEMDSVMRGLPNPWEPAKDGVAFRVGGVVVTPLFTPGHTPGSTCYRVDGACFVGDTLFAGSIGRPAGPQVFDQMLMHIRKKILSLPDDTAILPGHGPATTVAEERAHNPFFSNV